MKIGHKNRMIDGIVKDFNPLLGVNATNEIINKFRLYRVTWMGKGDFRE